MTSRITVYGADVKVRRAEKHIGMRLAAEGDIMPDGEPHPTGKYEHVDKYGDAVSIPYIVFYYLRTEIQIPTYPYVEPYIGLGGWHVKITQGDNAVSLPDGGQHRTRIRWTRPVYEHRLLRGKNYRVVYQGSDSYIPLPGQLHPPGVSTAELRDAYAMLEGTISRNASPEPSLMTLRQQLLNEGRALLKERTE